MAGLASAEKHRIELSVIRVRRFGASGKRRDPLESWFVWSGQSELELSEVWATYKRRFSIEHGFGSTNKICCGASPACESQANSSCGRLW